jgi:hypothetical protein
MPNQELVNYISFQLNKKVPWEEVKDILLAKGWTDPVLEENYQEFLKNKLSSSEAPEIRPEPKEEPSEEKKEIINPMFGFQNEAVEPVESIMEERAFVGKEEPAKFNLVLPEESADEPKQNIVNIFEPPKKQTKKSPNWGLFLIVFLILVAVGGGVFAYLTYFSSTPEKIIEKAIANFSKVESGQYYGTLNLQINSVGQNRIFDFSVPDNSKIVSNFSGVFDRNDPADIKGSLLVDGSLETGGETNTANFEIGMAGNSLYGLVNNVFLPQYPDTQRNVISLMTSSWIKYDVPDNNGQKVSVSINEKIDNLFNDAQFKKDLAGALDIKLLAAEKIDGIDCYHAQINFEKDKTKIIISDILTAQGQSSDPSFDEFYNNLFDNILSKSDTQIWIGKSDLLLRKLYFKSSGNINGIDASVDLSLGIKNQNQKVTIKPLPQLTKNWNDIKSSFGMISQEPGQAQPTVTDNNVLIEAQLNQLMGVAQAYKQSKATYVGFISGTEGKKIVGDITALGGNVAGVVTAKNMYCIATKLLDNKGYWCIDSSGNALISNNCTRKTYSCK